VPVEVGHAQHWRIASRPWRTRCPVGWNSPAHRTYLQPPEDQTNVASVIKGVIQAEQNAITQYNKIINLCEQRDYVTQEMAIQILGNEQDQSP